MTTAERDRKDAAAMLTAANVISRRAREQGNRTLATQLLIKALQRLAVRFDGGDK